MPDTYMSNLHCIDNMDPDILIHVRPTLDLNDATLTINSIASRCARTQDTLRPMNKKKITPLATTQDKKKQETTTTTTTKTAKDKDTATYKKQGKLSEEHAKFIRK